MSLQEDVFQKKGCVIDVPLSLNWDYMTGILEQLKWESEKMRRDSRSEGRTHYTYEWYCPQFRHATKHHSLAFQTPFTNTDIYKSSFLLQIIRDWN